jgi:trehalose 6-phosphate phosphatase
VASFAARALFKPLAMSGHTRTVSAALLPDALAPLRADPSRSAVLLDIDGTLAPIVERADEAHVPEPTRRLLIEVASRYALVACVSGRRASDARAMVAIGTIFYVGTHGAELLRPGQARPSFDPELEAWAPRIERFGQALDLAELRRRRVRLEHKGPILALHWRGAPDQQAARKAVEAVAARAEAAGLRTHWGRKVLEVRPPVSFDKGSGIAALLAQTEAGPGGRGEFDAALYAGDDTTDLDAFRALERLVDAGTITQAVRVAVSSDEGPAEIQAEADLVVEGTAGLRRMLEILVA